MKSGCLSSLIFPKTVLTAYPFILFQSNPGSACSLIYLELITNKQTNSCWLPGTCYLLFFFIPPQHEHVLNSVQLSGFPKHGSFCLKGCCKESQSD